MKATHAASTELIMQKPLHAELRCTFWDTVALSASTFVRK